MRTLLGLALLGLLLAPAASAHATVKSDDGQWWITTGNRFEPVTTWHRTSLDLIIRQVGPDDARVEVDELDAHQSLVATIVAPSGETMDCALILQSTANRYTCDEPYYLTEPGQYVVRLEGDIAGSPVDGAYDIAGPLPDKYEHTFPGSGVDDPAAMQARIAELEAKVAALEARSSEDGSSRGVPALPALAITALLLGLVALRRR